MLRARFVATAFTVVCAALGCSSSAMETDNAGDAIVDPNNSNIRSPELGQVTQLKLLPNTNVPRAAIVSLLVGRNNPASEVFVADLYEKILAINEAERLVGADGYQQQINLIVASQSASYEKLLTTIRARRGLASAEAVPLINLVEDVSVDDLWMQDFGEFAAVQGANAPGQTWYGLLDAGRYRQIDVDQLGRTLGISVTKIPAPQSAGTYGGNTEATAEGKLYIGDEAPAAYVDGLRNLGNPDAIVIPSNWLAVGHVDEYVTVLPARNACHSALAVSSGLEALNMARRAPAEFDAVFPGIGSAMDAYARTPRPANEDYALSDFDTSRFPANRAEEFVLQNLQAETYALDAIQKLSASSCVAQVIRLPQLYRNSRGKAIAATPGTVNSLVLRNHAILPDPHVDSLREVVRQRYAEALGSESNVHYIDDTLYHEADGEVHCGTNVIRELAMPYRM